MSPVQQRVLSSILAGRTFVEAANEAGITDRTIRRWREGCPVFESALRSQIKAVRESAAVLASIALQAAIMTLVEIASTPSHPLALREIQMIFSLNGPLKPISRMTGVAQVAEEQYLAELERIAGTGPRIDRSITPRKVH